ncbi:hypothetical protein LA76x_1547 [Lysobacter antibioticus]|uniref:Uncharacterized protein n=1 Tax=Lysobacter antibioticus TaxID=84531 RepID=A0A0S2F825_LYSAN|nr:hypothetical protein LA76x_1547 [Lysobacter antibioticus]
MRCCTQHFHNLFSLTRKRPLNPDRTFYDHTTHQFRIDNKK